MKMTAEVQIEGKQDEAFWESDPLQSVLEKGVRQPSGE